MPHSEHNSTRETTPTQDDSLSRLYWNINLERALWTKDSPVYLSNLPEKSVKALSILDKDFRIRTWEQVRELVTSNEINRFQRLPSQLRQYLKYMHELKKMHGSVMSYVQHNRLHWDSTTPSEDAPFSNPSDWKILYNDWPYGIDSEIAHLVVWTKFLLEDDPATDDLTPQAREGIEKFVEETFCGEGGVPRDQLVWFKNWRSLKSIHALEHFHVMLYKPSPGFLERITNGDRPTWTTLEG